MDFVGGSTEFLIFEIVLFFSVAYGLFTRRGSAINQHPYANPYDGAGRGPSELSGSDRHSWTRGTRP